MAYDLNDALTRVRDLIREKLPTGQTEGNWSDNQLGRYLEMSQLYAYQLEKEADSTKHITTTNITYVADTETYDLPSNCELILTVCDNDDVGEDEYSRYKLIDYSQRNDWTIYARYGKAYYIEDNKIGLLNNGLVADDIVRVRYQKTYTAMADGVDSDLSMPAQYVAILYAAELALKDRGDVNIASVSEERMRWEQMLHKARKHSTQPFSLDEFEYPYDALPFRVTSTTT